MIKRKTTKQGIERKSKGNIHKSERRVAEIKNKRKKTVVDTGLVKVGKNARFNSLDDEEKIAIETILEKGSKNMIKSNTTQGIERKSAEMIREYERRIEEIQNRKKTEGKKTVVNAGLLKAGKSSLFNALIGEEIFATDVIRVTTKNQKEETETYYLLDTPGLDACDVDNDVAEKGYKEADVVLFVHNLQEGELNQIEKDSIENIAKLFDDKKLFFKNSIMVLTHKDQVEDNYERIKNRIEEQCKQLFSDNFFAVHCVDSIGFLKGKKEKKELLVLDSGISDLMRDIVDCVNDKYSLKNGLIEKEKSDLIIKLNSEIDSIVKTVPQKYEYKNLSGLEKKIQAIVGETKKKVDSINVEIPNYSQKDFMYMCRDSRSGYSFQNESGARRAGEAAIEKNIGIIARETKSLCLSAVSHAENYIIESGTPNELRAIYSEAYEQIRKIAKNEYQYVVAQNFDIQISIPSNARESLKYVKDHARYIDSNSFSSVSYYKSQYSSDFYIDYDYRTKMETTFFGNYREKEYKVYSYDVSGAIDNIGYHAREIYADIRDSIFNASPSIKNIFNEIKVDLEKKFSNIVVSIKKDIEKKNNEQESQEKRINDEIRNKKQVVEELEKLKIIVNNI